LDVHGIRGRRGVQFGLRGSSLLGELEFVPAARHDEPRAGRSPPGRVTDAHVEVDVPIAIRQWPGLIDVVVVADQEPLRVRDVRDNLDNLKRPRIGAICPRVGGNDERVAFFELPSRSGLAAHDQPIGLREQPLPLSRSQPELQHGARSALIDGEDTNAIT